MALSIKSDEADHLARELADLTGESLTDAVTRSLRERLARERVLSGSTLYDRIMGLLDEVGELEVIDDRTADEIIGYDAHGLPT